MVYLFLTALWLGIGVVLIVWHWLNPEVRGLRIWGSDVSLGWLAVALAFYNLGRWYGRRANERRIRGTYDAKLEREAKGRTRVDHSSDPNLRLDSVEPREE
jgi:hypothetical protein